MHRLALLLTLALPSAASYADQFYTLVKYNCSATSDQLQLEYVGAFNEEGEALISNKGPNDFEPDAMVGVGDDTATERRTCALSDGKYTVVVGAWRGNTNIQGECGAFIGGWAEIRRNGTLVTRRIGFGSCRDDQIVTRVVIRAGQKVPSVFTLDRDVFYSLRPTHSK